MGMQPMRFTEELGQTYLGRIDHALLCYASDESIRRAPPRAGRSVPS